MSRGCAFDRKSRLPAPWLSGRLGRLMGGFITHDLCVSAASAVRTRRATRPVRRIHLHKGVRRYDGGFLEENDAKDHWLGRQSLVACKAVRVVHRQAHCAFLARPYEHSHGSN